MIHPILEKHIDFRVAAGGLRKAALCFAYVTEDGTLKATAVSIPDPQDQDETAPEIYFTDTSQLRGTILCLQMALDRWELELNELDKETILS